MNLSHPSENILVLGTSQDGGYPQTGCRAECCVEAWNDPEITRLVSSLAVLSGNECWLIDITPDFRHQLKMIEYQLKGEPIISGIFITHAHMGHYMGLLELGLEVMNTHDIPVYVMPKMKSFLIENAPFSQLIALNNIKLMNIDENVAVTLNKNLSITSFQVPHRNELSETVGFKIQSLNKSLVFISDIDSWEKWDVDINTLIQNNNILLLDGTFYSDGELSDRRIQDVPHPFIKKSLKKFSLLEVVDRKKVYFTHFNHTNPVNQKSSPERAVITEHCCQLAEDGMVFTL